MSSGKGGVYVNLMGVDSPRHDVEAKFFLGYTALGRPFRYEGKDWPIVPEDYKVATAFGSLAETLLEQERIKPHPAAVREDGLDGILRGMDDMKSGKISGEKLVYMI